MTRERRAFLENAWLCSAPETTSMAAATSSAPAPAWKPTNLSALLPLWGLDTALGLSSGRGARIPGETTEGPRYGSHGDRSPWESHRGITVPTPLPWRPGRDGNLLDGCNPRDKRHIQGCIIGHRQNRQTLVTDEPFTSPHPPAIFVSIALAMEGPWLIIILH
jgi:hypothetical protein